MPEPVVTHEAPSVLAGFVGSIRRKLLGHRLTSSEISGMEGEALIELISAKLAKHKLLDEAGTEFVNLTFASRLRLYRREAPKLKVQYRSTAFSISACGLVISGAAAAGNPGHAAAVVRWGVVALGLAVGLLTQLLQIWRMAERSVAYYHARSLLLRNAQAFIFDDGIYAQHNGEVARQFSVFRAQVQQIVADAAAIDEQSQAFSTHHDAAHDNDGGASRPPGSAVRSGSTQDGAE